MTIVDIKALVYSRFSPVISCFRLTRSTDQVISATCTDPTRLSIPAAIQSKYKLNIGILDMDVRSVWSSISQNEGPTDDLPTEIFEFNILLTDMSLWKPLAYTEYDKNTSVIKVLKAGKVRHRRSSSVRSKSFIVEDAPPSPLNLKITIPTKVAQDDKTQKLASTMMMMPFYEHLLDLRFFVTSSFYDRLKVQMEGKQHEVNPKDRFETLKTMAQKGVSLEQTLKTGYVCGSAHHSTLIYADLSCAMSLLTCLSYTMHLTSSTISECHYPIQQACTRIPLKHCFLH